MGANPSDKNSFKCESDYRYNPVVITFHIEHKPAISHTIYRIERVLHFRKIAPISFPGPFKPILHGDHSMWISSKKSLSAS
jgi:hypothetical protein